MALRSTIWTAGGVAAAIFLAGGFWAGKALSAPAATPRVEHATVRRVNEDGTEAVIRLAGWNRNTGLAVPDTVTWRDAFGTWNDGTRPACLRPLSSGQHITLGTITAEPVADAPGQEIVAWVECARRPVPHFRVVTPHTTRPS
jgi:hypothetical protein